MKEFYIKEYGYDNDDLQYALENNKSSFEPGLITHIVAEVPGQNDEFSWWWVLKFRDGRFFLLEGWCDYTGWDCQSGITEYGYFDTALEAAEKAPIEEEYSKRFIRNNLVKQVKGEQPLFTYQESSNKQEGGIDEQEAE